MLGLAFPNGSYIPAGVSKLGLLPGIPSYIVGKFFSPKLGSRLGSAGHATAWMSMPETAVDEDRHSEAGKDDIGGSGEIAPMEAKTKT